MKLKINIKRIRQRIRYSFFKKYKNQKIKPLHHLNLKYSLIWPSMLIPLDKILVNNTSIRNWIYRRKLEIHLGLFTNSNSPLYKVLVHPNFFWYQIFLSGLNLYLNLYIIRAIVKYLSINVKNSIKFRSLLQKFRIKINYYTPKIVDYIRKKLMIQWKKFDAKFLTTFQQNIIFYTEKLTDEAIVIKLNLIETYIRKFTQRLFLVTALYFLPYVCILGQLLSPTAAGHYPNDPIRWDFNLYKLLTFLPKFSELGLTTMYAGLPLAYAQNFQIYLIMGYFLIIQKNLNKFKINLSNQLNLSLSITFLLFNYAIFLIKSLLYGLIYRFYASWITGFSIDPSENFLTLIEWTLPLYITQPILTLVLIGLIYNCVIFIFKGYNPDIPIITMSAKKQMYINPN